MNAVLEKEFGLKVIGIKKLDAYDNSNYLLESEQDSFVFKTYDFSNEILDLVEAESETLLYLYDPIKNIYPAPYPFRDKSYVKILEIEGRKQICRMLSFLAGEFLAKVDHSETLFNSLGTFLAQLDLKLQGFSHKSFQARQWEWDLQYFDLNKKFLVDILSAKDRNIARYFFMQYEENVRPIAPSLRKQVIHNDANEWNLLVTNGTISGIIDFGDLAHSFLINELAIAIAYACLGKEDPVKWATFIIKSYHEKLALEEKELKVLYYLVAARLVTSVCNSAHAERVNPENSYRLVSKKPAWELLYRWLSINPVYAENQFRAAAGFDAEKPPAVKKVIEKRHQHISPILSVSYETPVYMQKSAFQYMYDAYGNTFLDAYNNIPHVGHSHPLVVEAGQKQMAMLNTNTRYLYDHLARYAEKLLSRFPDSLNKVFFVNSGSAASDLAIRMSRIHTGFQKLMVMESGYHGNTQMAIDISDYTFSNPKGQGQKDFIIKTPIPDSYRGKYTKADGDPGKLYAKEALFQIENSGSSIAAFICEPIVGCGGQVPLPPGYLEEIYPAIRKQGGVCISDEVQTGFGRLGDYFWGYEAQAVVPDMVILGKPMANGHPMGAVVCTKEIAESFEKGVEFFSSFGGNPVSCAIASAVLDVIEEEKLQENAKIVGEYYIHLLKELQKEFKSIGDVRGSGLFLGIEMVQEGSLKPDTGLAQWIKNELRKKHILISTDGPFDNVLKTKPPLVFTKENAKLVVDSIHELLTSCDSNKKI